MDELEREEGVERGREREREGGRGEGNGLPQALV